MGLVGGASGANESDSALHVGQMAQSGGRNSLLSRIFLRAGARKTSRWRQSVSAVIGTIVEADYKDDWSSSRTCLASLRGAMRL